MPTHARRIPAALDEVFSALNNVESYADWAPDVVESNVLAREGDVIVASFLSPFLIGGRYVLEFVRSNRTSIVYKQVGQYGARGLQGSWRLSESVDGTVVTGEMTLRTDVWKAGVNGRRTALVLQRRLESLERILSSSDATSPFGAIPADQALVVRAGAAKYALVRCDE